MLIFYWFGTWSIKSSQNSSNSQNRSSYLVSNYMYRPFSLLSIFNKLIEKVMYNRIISCLEKFSVLHNNQFGFRLNMYLSNSYVCEIWYSIEVKYLGLIFDSNLTELETILHELSKKVWRGIGALSKIRYYVNGNTVHIIILFNYLPLPHLWFINLGQYLYLQKRAKRTITFFKTRWTLWASC